MGAIEDIVLDRGVRTRISALRRLLPENYIEDAAKFILLDNPAHAFILTGFYIPTPYQFPLPESGSVETDGPPGAYFLGQALRKLGWKVTYVTDHFGTFCFQGMPGGENIIEFPITDAATSEQYAKDLLARHNPSVVIAIERVGATAKGQYLNIRGWDITARTARLDFLLTNHHATVGIGDGGNEIGLGNFAEHTAPLLPSKDPTVTHSTHPIIAGVSNWGGYALIAAMSKISRINLLPHPDMEMEYIQRMVDKGMVTGSGLQQYNVDGFPLEENRRVIDRYWDYLYSLGITKFGPGPYVYGGWGALPASFPGRR